MSSIVHAMPRVFHVVLAGALLLASCDETNATSSSGSAVIAVGALVDVDVDESYVLTRGDDGSFVVTPRDGTPATVVAAASTEPNDSAWFVGRSSTVIVSRGQLEGPSSLAFWQPGMPSSATFASFEKPFWPVLVSEHATYVVYGEPTARLGEYVLTVVKTSECTDTGCPTWFVPTASASHVFLASTPPTLVYAEYNATPTSPVASVVAVDLETRTSTTWTNSASACLTPDGSTLVRMDATTRAVVAHDIESGADTPWATPDAPDATHFYVSSCVDVDVAMIATFDASEQEHDFACGPTTCVERDSALYMVLPKDDGGPSRFLYGRSTPSVIVSATEAASYPADTILRLTVSDDESRYLAFRASDGGLLVGTMPPTDLATAMPIAIAAYPGERFVEGSTAVLYPTKDELFVYDAGRTRSLGPIEMGTGQPFLVRGTNVYRNTTGGVRVTSIE